MNTTSILIIDDNPDDIEITQVALGEMGRKEEVEAVTSGEEAMKRLRSSDHLPGVILLDLKMPGMSGFDCLREIRTDESLKHIPVIVVTSSSLEAEEQKSYAFGADSFLYKSIDIDRFGKSLDNLLQRFLNKS